MILILYLLCVVERRIRVNSVIHVNIIKGTMLATSNIYRVSFPVSFVKMKKKYLKSKTLGYIAQGCKYLYKYLSL